VVAVVPPVVAAPVVAAPVVEEEEVVAPVVPRVMVVFGRLDGVRTAPIP